MALRIANMVKNGAGKTTLELKADVGESILVKDIFVKSVADKYLLVKIDRVTVGSFRVDDADLGNVLHYPPADSEKKTILGYLFEKGIFTGFPIAEGQTLELSDLGTTAIYATILYDLYDAGDQLATMPNGSEAREYLFLNYGNTGAALNTKDDHLYDTQVSPTEFPAFPWGKVVPADTEIDIIGILASERGADDGSVAANYIHTTYYKMVRGREVLFDEDRSGIYAQGATVATGGTFEPENGQGIMGEYSDLAKRLPYLFPEPLTFASGAELNIYVTTEVAGTPGTLELAEQEICLIEKVRRV